MPFPIGAIDAAYVARLLANSPTLVAPTIASFINAQHNHQNAAGGGSLDAVAIGSGVLANARVNFAAPDPIGGTTPNAVAATTATATVTDAGTNTIVDALIVGHDTSNGGSLAQGFGTGIRLRAQSNNVADRDLARFRAYWDSTAGVDASRKSNATISVWNIGVETDVITFLPTQIQPNVPIRIANNVGFGVANAAGSTRNMLLWSGSDTLVIGSSNGSGDNGLVQLFAGGVSVVIVSSTQIVLSDAKNIAVGTTTGTKIGTATTQKLAFWNATPVVQPSGANQAAVVTTSSTQTTPFGYTTAAQADGIVTLLNAIRGVLVTIGIMKGAA